MTKLPLHNGKGEPTGEVDFPDALLTRTVGQQAVHDAVVTYRYNQRRWSAHTLGKGQVAGSNKKPWRQKGLGRARAGYRQSPVWRGGAVALGPQPLIRRREMPKRLAQLALRRAWSEQVAAGAIRVVDELVLAAPKTREMVALLKSFKAQRGALVVLDKPDAAVLRAARNIGNLIITTAPLMNVYELLRHPTVIVTRAALAGLEQRLQKSGRNA